MSSLSRRTFLAGTAALVSGPAFAAQRNRNRGSSSGGGSGSSSNSSSDVDCIIVGAGAAGIAAARRFMAAKRSFILVEASNRVGGRCIVDTQSFGGIPFDRGAHVIYGQDSNPLARLATSTGLDVYPASSAQRIRIGRRNAREGELEDFLAATVKATRAIADASRTKDIDCASALPKDLGDWKPTVEFALGPYNNGKDLNEISAMDLSHAPDRYASSFCRQGYGALLAKLAQGIPVQLDTAVKSVEITGRGTRVEATTTRGTIGAANMIITASTNVLASGLIKFEGDTPSRHVEAWNKLKLGSFDHIALELPGNPLGLQRDDLVFEQSSGPRTGALLANVSGTPLSIIEVGGRFGRELTAKGDKAMVEFAVEWLAGMFGNDVKAGVKRTQTTQWNKDPWALGAFATASPGGAGARKALMEPLRNRVYFAGEAIHETQWGTVGGAWESGTRAADAIVRRLTGQPEAKLPETEGSHVERPRPRIRHRR
jgi:monoamine oxidase